MEGLFLKIQNSHEHEQSTLRLAEIRINEESSNTRRLKLPIGTWITIEKQPKQPGTKYSFLKCFHCSHEDFNEDGERLNDYVCNGCGSTISATEYRIPNNTKVKIG